MRNASCYTLSSKFKIHIHVLKGLRSPSEMTFSMLTPKFFQGYWQENPSTYLIIINSCKKHFRKSWFKECELYLIDLFWTTGGSISTLVNIYVCFFSPEMSSSIFLPWGSLVNILWSFQESIPKTHNFFCLKWLSSFLFALRKNSYYFSRPNPNITSPQTLSLTLHGRSKVLCVLKTVAIITYVQV